jgi:hypothetical protein
MALHELPELVRLAPTAVVLVQSRPPLDPDLVLAWFRVGGAVVAWVDPGMPDASHPRTAAWIASQNARIGRASGYFRPGYYLFLGGAVRAYQSGLVDFKRDYLSVGIGGVVGLIALFDNRISWMKNSVYVFQAQATLRVVGAFMNVIAARAQTVAAGAQRTASAPPKPPPHSMPALPPAPPIDELAVAFETFDLQTTATQAEVKVRYRELAKQWHPDRFVDNHPNANVAAMRMTQINVAYSVICAARGW